MSPVGTLDQNFYMLDDIIPVTQPACHRSESLALYTSDILVTKIKTRTRIIGRRFQKTRTRITVTKNENEIKTKISTNKTNENENFCNKNEKCWRIMLFSFHSRKMQPLADFTAWRNTVSLSCTLTDLTVIAAMWHSVWLQKNALVVENRKELKLYNKMWKTK